MLGAPLAAPAKLVFKALGLSAQSDVTEEDVLSFVDDVEEHDLIDESQKKMITNIFELDDVTAGDVMTHRTEIVSVADTATAHDVVELSLAEGVSRIPVYRKTLDDIEGIVYVKDLFTRFGTTPRRRPRPPPPASLCAARCSCRKPAAPRSFWWSFGQSTRRSPWWWTNTAAPADLPRWRTSWRRSWATSRTNLTTRTRTWWPPRTGLLPQAARIWRSVRGLGLEPPDEDEDGEADFDTVGGLIIDRLGRIPARGKM
ncbi:MAG: CBS domain-containing protein [Ruthenibacterium lactatiformans]